MLGDNKRAFKSTDKGSFFHNEKAFTCISICLGCSMNFSIRSLSSPKLDFASCELRRKPSLKLCKTRIIFEENYIHQIGVGDFLAGYDLQGQSYTYKHEYSIRSLD